MQIERMELEEVRAVYEQDMVYQFPPEEVKPFSSIRSLMRRGMYSCFALREGKDLLAYAFFMHAPQNSHALLDYYVVCTPYRNKGYGSAFLEQLAEVLARFDSILVEAENPAYAESAAERTQQERRISFYERNGFRKTALRVNLFSMEYVILQRELCATSTDREARLMLDGLYRAMLGDFYETELSFHEAEAEDGD